MHSKILLGKILQRFADQKTAKGHSRSSFDYIRETQNAVFVTRLNGLDTEIPFDKIGMGIDLYKSDPSLYHESPTALRVAFTHINSPVWALLHLLEEDHYSK